MAETLTLDEFEIRVAAVYAKLPHGIRQKFHVEIEEIVPAAFHGQPPFGYVHGMNPETVVLSYPGFLRHGDFSRGHIERVIKHEVEHVLFGAGGRHSEH